MKGTVIISGEWDYVGDFFLFFHIFQLQKINTFLMKVNILLPSLNMDFTHQSFRNTDLKWQIFIFTIESLASMPDSWYLCPCIITSPWKCAGPNELHLINRIQQTRGDVTSKISLQKLGFLTYSCSLSGLLFLLSLIRTALLEGLSQQATEGGLLLITSEGTKQSVEYILRNWTLTKTT